MVHESVTIQLNGIPLIQLIKAVCSFVSPFLFQQFPGCGQRAFTSVPHILFRSGNIPQQPGVIMQFAPGQRILWQLGQQGQGLLFGAHG